MGENKAYKEVCFTTRDWTYSWQSSLPPCASTSLAEAALADRSPYCMPVPVSAFKKGPSPGKSSTNEHHLAYPDFLLLAPELCLLEGESSANPDPSNDEKSWTHGKWIKTRSLGLIVI